MQVSAPSSGTAPLARAPLRWAPGPARALLHGTEEEAAGSRGQVQGSEPAGGSDPLRWEPNPRFQVHRRTAARPLHHAAGHGHPAQCRWQRRVEALGLRNCPDLPPQRPRPITYHADVLQGDGLLLLHDLPQMPDRQLQTKRIDGVGSAGSGAMGAREMLLCPQPSSRSSAPGGGLKLGSPSTCGFFPVPRESPSPHLHEHNHGWLLAPCYTGDVVPRCLQPRPQPSPPGLPRHISPCPAAQSPSMPGWLHPWH